MQYSAAPILPPAGAAPGAPADSPRSDGKPEPQRGYLSDGHSD